MNKKRFAIVSAVCAGLLLFSGCTQRAEEAADTGEDAIEDEGPGGYYDEPDMGGGERVGETDEASTPD